MKYKMNNAIPRLLIMQILIIYFSPLYLSKSPPRRISETPRKITFSFMNLNNGGIPKTGHPCSEFMIMVGEQVPIVD